MKRMQVPFALLIGDGVVSFGVNKVVCEHDEALFEIPPELAALVDQQVSERQRMLGFELTNEPSYRLGNFAVQSGANGAAPTLRLHLQRSNYFNFVATNLSLDRPILPGGATIRERYVHDITRLSDSPLASSMSVMVLLISTPDKMALLPRRSEHVAFDQGCLQVSGGGAMRLAVDSDEALNPSPFVTAQREMAEELGVRLPLDSIRFLGLGVDTRTGEPELLGVAETPLTVEQIRHAYSEAKHGNDELDDVVFAPFTPEAVGRLLIEDQWCPGDWVCAWLALVEAFGQERMAQVLTWETCHGVVLPLPPGAQAVLAAQAGEAIPEPGLLEKLRQWRKGLPLPVRMAYGWIKRQSGRGRHWLWDNAEFKQWYTDLMETQWWSREQLENLQLVRMQHLLRHAYDNVPYYRRLLDERGLKPTDFTALSDLQKLPILTKEDVKRNLRELVARNVEPSRLYYMMTGGTTGTPVGFYHERGITYPHEAAFQYRQWTWMGYRFGDPIAYIRGRDTKHRDWAGRPAWWDYEAADNALLLPVYNMSEATLPNYVQKLREFRPRFLEGYASAFERLARYMLAEGIRDIRPKAVISESENLYPAQRALIEQAFGCPVVAGYGLSERAADAVECDRREGYHISMEYGIVELTDEDGNPVPPGESGFITGTGLDTHCMPFIRYQTDDVARFADHECSCGRHMPMLTDLVGRWQHEVVVTADDRLIPITGLNVHTDAFDNVAQYQFYQEKKGELILRVVRLPSYTEGDTRAILQALQAKFRSGMEVRVVFVPEIEKTRRGKHRMLDQKLSVGAPAAQES